MNFQKKHMAIAATTALLVMLVAACALATELPASKYKTRVIAHRGASGHAPENTMAAFKKALELGAEMFELDVYHTLDGELIVMHDEDPERTTGVKGVISLMSAAEIARLDAGSWFDKQFAGEPVPTLRQTLEWAKNKIQVNIEIKSEGCEQGVVKLVNELDMKDTIIVTSFKHDVIKLIKELDPDIRTGALVRDIDSAKYIDEIIEACHPDAINPRYIMVNKKIVKAAHERGLTVNVYTVNDSFSMKRMIDFGVDGVITNYPDILLEVLDKIKKK